MTNDEPQDMCCFCDQPIAVQGTDPCELALIRRYWTEDAGYGDDMYFCHLECFKARLHPDYVQYLLEERAATPYGADDER